MPQRLLRVGADWIPRLQPLWESLHHHHAAVAPHLAALGRVRRPEESRFYERLGVLPFVTSFLGAVPPA